jgi:hypothetical protein
MLIDMVLYLVEIPWDLWGAYTSQMMDLEDYSLFPFYLVIFLLFYLYFLSMMTWVLLFN